MKVDIDQILIQISWEQKEIVITQADVDAIQLIFALAMPGMSELSKTLCAVLTVRPTIQTVTTAAAVFACVCPPSNSSHWSKIAFSNN